MNIHNGLDSSTDHFLGTQTRESMGEVSSAETRFIRPWPEGRAFPIGPDVPDVTDPKHGVCYFAGAFDRDGTLELIKIGFSANVEFRMGQLQSTAALYDIHLLAGTCGGRDQERRYHRRFAEHATGGEWFTPAPEILAEIDRLNAQVAA